MLAIYSPFYTTTSHITRVPLYSPLATASSISFYIRRACLSTLTLPFTSCRGRSQSSYAADAETRAPIRLSSGYPTYPGAAWVTDVETRRQGEKEGGRDRLPAHRCMHPWTGFSKW